MGVTIALSVSSPLLAQYRLVDKGENRLVEWQFGSSEVSVDTFVFINRLSNEIEEFKKQDALIPSKECDVLFTGSSSIRLWETLEQDMSPLKVRNRGYGASTIRDLIYNYDLVVKPHQPKVVVLYTGNDLAGWRNDPPVYRVFDFYRLFVEKVKADYPGIKVYIIAMTVTINRESNRKKVELFNEILKSYTRSQPLVECIDANARMQNADGTVKKELFESDMLHLNKAGYAIWISLLKPKLLKDIQQ